MNISGTDLGIDRARRTGQPVEPDPFDLDIRVIEFGDAASMLVNVTDDNCGSSCPRACATNMG